MAKATPPARGTVITKAQKALQGLKTKEAPALLRAPSVARRIVTELYTDLEALRSEGYSYKQIADAVNKETGENIDPNKLQNALAKHRDRMKKKKASHRA